MLSRKGTMSRKNRASVRRGRGRGTAAGAASGYSGGVSSVGSGSLMKHAATTSSWPTSPMSASHSSPVSLKSPKPREVSFSTLDSYCYAMDNISTCSDVSQGCDLRIETNHNHEDSANSGNALTPYSCARPSVMSTVVHDLSPSEHVRLNYQSLAVRKLTPPPSDKPIYESTVVWAEVEDTDTHYSLVGSLSEARIEAKNPCDFIQRSMFVICGTWPVTVFTLVLLALPLVMTAIGVNYLHECPREPKLPIYLVVGGCFGIIKLIFVLWRQIKRHRDDVIDLHDDDDLLTVTRMTNIALNVFLCVWFVFGHYWLIRIWKPHFVAPLHEPRNWCDEAVFLFTFWQLIICHIIIALVLLTAIILYCCYICVTLLFRGNQNYHTQKKAKHQQQMQQKQSTKR